MTNCELLEMVAKAAGIAVVRARLHDLACQDFLIRGSVRNLSQDLGPWNPLADDGDALRLACDLGFRVFPIARTQSGAACSAVGSATGERLSEVADASLDTYTATRRAIVLAAAEIGKQMEGGQHGAE